MLMLTRYRDTIVQQWFEIEALHEENIMFTNSIKAYAHVINSLIFNKTVVKLENIVQKIMKIIDRNTYGLLVSTIMNDMAMISRPIAEVCSNMKPITWNDICKSIQLGHRFME